MNLSRRITLFSTGMLFLLLLLVNAGIYFVFQHNMLQGELDRTLQQGRTVTEAVSSQPGEDPVSYFESYVSGEGMVRIIAPDGSTQLSVTSQNTRLSLIPVFEAEAQSESAESFIFEGERYASARVPLLWEGGAVVTLEVVEPLDMYEQTMQTLRIALIFASLAVLLPSFLAARSLSNFVLRPIKALVATMKQIEAEGTFKKIELKNNGKDELAEMGRTFNHMMDLLKANYEKQQQFVSDASHELKTPLTVIGSYAQLLKRRGSERPEVFEESVEAISSEAERMREMTEQMLALAAGENSALEKESIDLSPVFEKVSVQLGRTREREIEIQAEPGSFVYGNELQLKQLAYLLIENALKYSSEAVRVAVKQKDDSVLASVTDRGVGIAPEDLPHIFERFYRVDKAREREKGGTGLGLAIAESIASSHGGEIQAESVVGLGTTFTVSFPFYRKAGGEGE
ncbi:sensor histidine kinase [Alkalicoccus halolimnae]|uniref:Signal transduction histidine-protein kinase ArlS n=1 Tax=Alkalicoccus halolimnae TaxID=1667239 RepID=A0A5C7FEJ0_9BACI|nr:HAMP domain-containing histidine kinase [Alkalicoccus halolimnae]TXF82301.1 HAMP domain-containing histidine kinase [Alkalicoccus halolimnae]